LKLLTPLLLTVMCVSERYKAICAANVRELEQHVNGSRSSRSR
jgi:hypothetical protein